MHKKQLVKDYSMECMEEVSTYMVMHFLQEITDEACAAAGCKAIWGTGNQLYVSAGSRRPFRGLAFLFAMVYFVDRV